MTGIAAQRLMPTAGSGRYQVGEVLARGGMGSVHTAVDRLAERPVAYKRLTPSSDSTRSRLTALFKREYDTLTHLTHPNIVEVYDFGFDDTGPYYTMELLSGSDLTKLAPLSVRDACRVLRDVASALALLHARRLVHRDVSPNNVRLTAEGRAKLLDFGGMTGFGIPTEIVGTPAFIAPECLQRAPLDQRTDLYSLGALAYWTLTRRLHAPAHTIEELTEAWKHEVVPPSHYAPEVPRELDELVLALLQHDPVARPRHASDVIERLTTIAQLGPEQDESRVASSYLEHGPQQGHEEPLSVLVRALRGSLAGAGHTVLLEADPGLGRSALLDRIAVEAQLAGAIVLRAGGNLHTAAFSAARHLVKAGSLVFPDLAERARGLISTMPVGSGRDERSGPRSNIDASEQQIMFASILQEELLALSLRAPLVLLIDDAHTVDAESMALFASLVETVRSYPILFILSVQSQRDFLQREAQSKLEASAERCKLHALDEQQVNALVGTLFGEVQNRHLLAVWLYQQTGGNPGHCIDLSRLLLARGDIRYTVGTFTLPQVFDTELAVALHGQAALARLADLPVSMRNVANLLGLHDGPLTNQQLADATQQTPRELVLAVEQLQHRGVAVVSDDDVSCASDALRTALRNALSVADKRAAHLALARAIGAQAPDTLASLLGHAHHLLSAGGEEALEGASLLAGLDEKYKLELATIKGASSLLEWGLSVLEARRLPDVECLGLLIPLSLFSFYGRIDLQERYLSRTMGALSDVCGVTRARRLSVFVGTQLGLILGILTAWIMFRFTQRSLNRRSFVQHLGNIGSVPSSACAASASVWDATESYRVAHMLDVFENAGKSSAIYLMREFCLATAEVVSVKTARAIERYSRLFEIFQGKVFGMDEVSLEQLRCGCLHGKAQALVTDAAPEALTLADELERRGPFFAPHAAGVRMSYHLYRGEMHKAVPWRERAESLALRAGTSWSALTMLTIRLVQGCVAIGDVVTLVHVVAELARLAKVTPNIGTIHALAEGHLELLRGRPERALAIYERVLPTERARALPSYPMEAALHAQALSALGRHQEARALCMVLLDEIAASQREGDQNALMPRLCLAQAEAELGNFVRASELVDGCFERAGRFDNPLAMGSVHRARARIALLAGDNASFERHLASTSERFAATENPWLIQQTDALRADGARLGIGRAGLLQARPTDDLDGGTELQSSLGGVVASGTKQT